MLFYYKIEFKTATIINQDPTLDWVFKHLFYDRLITSSWGFRGRYYYIIMTMNLWKTRQI